MKIESGKQAFEFEAGADGQPRAATLGVVSAIRAALNRPDGEEPDRFKMLARLQVHVKREAKLELSDDEADGLLDALLELDAKKKQRNGTPTSATSTTSTPSA